MIHYIYFVKCPNCEDEHFDFFDDAKAFALGCLGDKPIITQTEVCRNDFGECTDSHDLGTVWSWEELLPEDSLESDPVEFSKKTTLDCIGSDCEYNADNDPEFANLDNSLDDLPNNFKKPIPDGMTIEGLVEAMEENEDTVECKVCEELFPKASCQRKDGLGYVCEQCGKKALVEEDAAGTADAGDASTTSDCEAKSVDEAFNLDFDDPGYDAEEDMLRTDMLYDQERDRRMFDLNEE